MTDIRQAILKTLEESSNPLGPAAIASKLHLSKETERSKIHYHLKKLEKENSVICFKEGKYWIKKEELRLIRELEIKILERLAVKEYYLKELKEEMGQDESKIISAIHLLEGHGLIKEGEISLSKRGGFPRKGLISLVDDYLTTSTYVPTYLGYSKIGLCPICKEKLKDSETIILTFFKQVDDFRKRPWLATKIHSKCLPKSKAYDTAYGKHEPSIFCYHCGLPLTPKMLPRYPVNYELLKDHFFSFELDSINLLEELEESWIVSVPPASFSKERRGTSPQNSTIRKVYDKLDLEVPEWLDQRLKDDENNPDITQYEEISWHISNNLTFAFDGDLSKLKTAEKFLELLFKYRSSCPEGYNISSRTKEIWTAAQDIKKNYYENIRTSYEKLLGPEANLYSYIDWAFNSVDYDFDKPASLHYDRCTTTIFAQTFAIKCKDRYYHPYCADKLRSNSGHCNDNNSKGGEDIE